MPCYYNQRTGQFRDFDGTLRRGYSGAPGYINNPAAEGLRDRGPIPTGEYRIRRLMDTQGKNTVEIIPHNHDAHGRDNFRIHGDSRETPGQASKGCIVLNGADFRARLHANSDKVVIVVDEPEWE